MVYEQCVSGIEGLAWAKRYSLDRIELCQNLEQGGTTPSTGMIQKALDLGLETHVLIRPRAGNFNYNTDELEVMKNDIQNCRLLGVNGIVVGVLNERNEVDSEALKTLVEEAKGMQLTFHRAFDDTTDWKEAIDEIIGLGFNRILTAGLTEKVDLGMDNLKSIMDHAAHRIEIMVGGGVDKENLMSIKEGIKPDAIHFSGTSYFSPNENSMFSNPRLEVDEKKIMGILNLR